MDTAQHRAPLIGQGGPHCSDRRPSARRSAHNYINEFGHRSAHNYRKFGLGGGAAAGAAEGAAPSALARRAYVGECKPGLARPKAAMRALASGVAAPAVPVAVPVGAADVLARPRTRGLGDCPRDWYGLCLVNCARMLKGLLVAAPSPLGVVLGVAVRPPRTAAPTPRTALGGLARPRLLCAPAGAVASASSEPVVLRAFAGAAGRLSLAGEPARGIEAIALFDDSPKLDCNPIPSSRLPFRTSTSRSAHLSVRPLAKCVPTNWAQDTHRARHRAHGTKR